MSQLRSVKCIIKCIAAIPLALAGWSLATSTASDPILGRWLTDDGKGIVTIAPCGAALCGQISQVLDRSPDVPTTDVNNPDPALRQRRILGLPVLTGFRREGSQWGGGRAYDPKSGSSYRSRLNLNSDGSLRVTGCVLFICQSKRWRRMP